MEYTFKRVSTLANIVVSIIVVLAGLALTLLVPQANVAGFILIIIGALMLVLWRSAYKVPGDGATLSKKTFDLPGSRRQDIFEYLDGKGGNLDLSHVPGDERLRLETWFNKGAEVAYIQLFEFSNYSYEDIGGVRVLRGDSARDFLSRL